MTSLLCVGPREARTAHNKPVTSTDQETNAVLELSDLL